MADKIVSSIFGVDPAMYSQLKNQQNYAQALSVGNQYAVPGTMMNPSLGPLYTQAAQQGQLIGQGVGTLLGAQDPELQKITAIKQLSSQFDLTSPTGMREFSRALQQIAPNESMMAAKRADEMTLNAATVAQKTREKSIPTSGLGKLLYEKNQLLAQGVAPNDPQVLAYDKAISAEGEGKGTKIIMPEQKQQNILGDKRVGKILELEDNALQAQDTLQTVNDFKGLLKNSFTGFASGAKLTAGQFANALGVQVTGTSETEQLNQLFAALTTGQAKNLKGSLSDKDLKFLKEAVGTSGLTLTSLQNAISRIEREALIEDKLYSLVSAYKGD